MSLPVHTSGVGMWSGYVAVTALPVLCVYVCVYVPVGVDGQIGYRQGYVCDQLDR